ncbi:MAG TPA: hypothetical protein DD979_15495 [Gammaproteobacteria bacterium]|jgi:signal transduction histidine kinase|nr:hypothetical protein [Gammaproteobacteria bacterium]
MPQLSRFLPDDSADRVLFIASLFLQLLIASVVVMALWRQQWLVSFTGAIIFALTFTPAIIERQLEVQLPVEFTLVTCVFLYASYGLGEYGQFYHRYWWWDLFLHSFSALVMGLIGFLVVYVFYMTHKVRLQPIYIAAVSFGFAMTIGALWEIFEFSMDWLFGFNMQKSGLVDTMTDLIVDMIGGLVAAAIGYSYVKGGDSLIADRVVKNFMRKNPQLFRRRRRREDPR